MENRNVRDQEKELKNEDLVVVDECEDEEMKKEELVVVDEGEEEETKNEEGMVVDDWKEEASDAPSASAGIGLINFLL